MTVEAEEEAEVEDSQEEDDDPREEALRAVRPVDLTEVRPHIRPPDLVLGHNHVTVLHDRLGS